VVRPILLKDRYISRIYFVNDAGSKLPAPNHPVSLVPRPSGRCFIVEGLKERLVRLKTRFFQIFGHVILGLVVHREQEFGDRCQRRCRANGARLLEIKENHQREMSESGRPVAVSGGWICYNCWLWFTVVSPREGEKLMADIDSSEPWETRDKALAPAQRYKRSAFATANSAESIHPLLS
jgi:hypothetical protein